MEKRPIVVLVHGFFRTGASMWPMAVALRRAGFQPRPVTLWALNESIPTLADRLEHRLRTALLKGRAADQAVHFVTHSMGGPVVRSLLSRHEVPGAHRVVMLAPPMRGSALARHIHDDVLSLPWGSFDPARKFLPGERGDCEGAGEPRAEVGILAGASGRTFLAGAPWSWMGALKGRPFDLGSGDEHDGKVRVDEARWEGARDFRVVPYGHNLIMMNGEVTELCVRFLRTGRFGEG